MRRPKKGKPSACLLGLSLRSSPAKSMRSSIDWLIIGGGPHGVHLAARLVGEAGIDAGRLGILDPGARLLDRWRAFTAATGMSHLRSPGVHHLDLEPLSLRRFAGNRRGRPPGLLRGRYDRPSLDLFNTHCDHVIERFGLAKTHLRGQAELLEAGGDGVQVTTSDGMNIEAGRVVLAIGAGGQPEWPPWASREESRIQHIFDCGASWPRAEQGDGERILIVGGGISAAQLALRLAAEGRTVDLVIRHPFRVHHFDSDPGWLGPKLMPIFDRERNPDRRRRLIQQARHRGSVTRDVRHALRVAAARGRLRIREEAVSSLQVESGGLRLELASGQMIEGSRLVLATGFATRRPGGRMLDRLIEDLHLPCAACGFPVVDYWLRWHPRIHVSGPLAELELGPVSRNIAGARRAGDRLVQALARLRAAA